MREFENCAKNKDVSKVCVHDVEGIGITRFETLFAVILAIITLHPCQFIQFTSCRFYLRCSDNTSFLTIYWTLLSILRESGFFPTLHAAPWCVSSSSNLDTVLATFRQDESINNSFGSAHCQMLNPLSRTHRALLSFSDRSKSKLFTFTDTKNGSSNTRVLCVCCSRVVRVEYKEKSWPPRRVGRWRGGSLCVTRAQWPGTRGCCSSPWPPSSSHSPPPPWSSTLWVPRNTGGSPTPARG